MRRRNLHLLAVLPLLAVLLLTSPAAPIAQQFPTPVPLFHFENFRAIPVRSGVARVSWRGTGGEWALCVESRNAQAPVLTQRRKEAKTPRKYIYPLRLQPFAPLRSSSRDFVLTCGAAQRFSAGANVAEVAALPGQVVRLTSDGRVLASATVESWRVWVAMIGR